MAQQTAVEWFFENLLKSEPDILEWQKIFEQAKAMEKEQIIEAHKQGYRDGYMDNGNGSIDYYHETFKSE